MTEVIIGIFGTLCALAGVELAAGAIDDGMYVFGFALALFGCFLAFFMMKLHFDAADAARRSE
jgi:hypothetical protein